MAATPLPSTERSAVRAGSLVSLVVPVYDEAEVVGAFYERATGALSGFAGLGYEILFVDDGSRDSS